MLIYSEKPFASQKDSRFAVKTQKREIGRLQGQLGNEVD